MSFLQDFHELTHFFPSQQMVRIDYIHITATPSLIRAAVARNAAFCAYKRGRDMEKKEKAALCKETGSKAIQDYDNWLASKRQKTSV